MTQATATTPPDIAHQSTSWAGGTAQQTTAWCFAAAEQTVQAAFGGTAVSQAQLAHESLMYVGGQGINEHGSLDYFEGVQNLWLNLGLNDTSWASVSVHVTGNQRLNALLRGGWGLPPFTGRVAAAGGALTTVQVMATIDANGLVVKGDRYHYTVIHGYRRVSGVVSYHVYDPMSGASSWVAATGFWPVQSAISYRVTG